LAAEHEEAMAREMNKQLHAEAEEAQK